MTVPESQPYARSRVVRIPHWVPTTRSLISFRRHGFDPLHPVPPLPVLPFTVTSLQGLWFQTRVRAGASAAWLPFPPPGSSTRKHAHAHPLPGGRCARVQEHEGERSRRDPCVHALEPGGRRPSHKRWRRRGLCGLATEFCKSPCNLTPKDPHLFSRKDVPSVTGRWSRTEVNLEKP